MEAGGTGDPLCDLSPPSTERLPLYEQDPVVLSLLLLYTLEEPVHGLKPLPHEHVEGFLLLHSSVRLRLTMRSTP